METLYKSATETSLLEIVEWNDGKPHKRETQNWQGNYFKENEPRNECVSPLHYTIVFLSQHTQINDCLIQNMAYRIDKAPKKVGE